MDSRVRTGEERRERMRSLLIQAALIAYSRYDRYDISINEFIKLAGVSRGTFYNHFKTSEELFEAVSVTVCAELMAVVNPVVLTYEDPAERVSCGVRLCLEICRKYREVALFISRGGAGALRENPLLNEYLPRDLIMGIKSKRFSQMTPQLAFDLVVGPVLAGFHTLATDADAGVEYINNLSMSVLQSLGISSSDARKISRMQLEPVAIADDFLIAQSYKHARTNGAE